MDFEKKLMQHSPEIQIAGLGFLQIMQQQTMHICQLAGTVPIA